MQPTLTFIGKVRSSLKTLEDCPLQENESAPPAEIIIVPEFTICIKSLKPGAEIVVLTWLHQADRSVLQCIPRRNFDAPPLGVFSTRSPDRPNPVGLHIAKIISISEGGIIRVEALEVLDQTPVIDIKPVLKSQSI